MKRGLLAYLTPAAALILAAIVGFFSVTGLATLFAGAALAVTVLAATLESVKILGTALLHVYWKKLSWYVRLYMVIGVIVLMGITSAGVYGLLAGGYQSTANELSINNKEIQLIENKKIVFESKIKTLDEQKQYKNEQINTLVGLRTQQETRLDSLLSNNHWVNAKRTQEDIDEASSDIKELQAEVDTILVETGAYNDSIAKLDIKIMEMESTNDAARELGPLMYIAELTGTPMDKVINWLMMLLIFVADPFAVMLVIATTKIWGKNEDEDQPKKDNFITRLKRKRALKKMMKQDQELGLYDEPQINTNEEEEIESKELDKEELDYMIDEAADSQEYGVSPSLKEALDYNSEKAKAPRKDRLEKSPTEEELDELIGMMSDEKDEDPKEETKGDDIPDNIKQRDTRRGPNANSPA